MAKMEIRVLAEIEAGVEVGSHPCACGGCRPTATSYRDDPLYRDHDGALAEGPCCCGRFFVIGPEAEERGRAMAAEHGGLDAYAVSRGELGLPWGATTRVLIADLAE